MEKLRVVYSKSKEAVYMSHLDTMRAFEEALIKADIVAKHSEGYNPRPELVFAHPLSVGVESTGEIFEVTLEEHIDIPYFVKQINNVLPNGLIVLSCEYVDEKEKNIMSRVYAAKYLIEYVYQTEQFKNMNIRQVEDKKQYLKNKMQAFLEQDMILVIKKSKDRMERIDIKPQIINFSFLIDGNLEVTINTGSTSNLNPNYIMTGYQEYIDEEIDYKIKRLKIFYK